MGRVQGTHCRVKDGKLQMLAIRTASVSVTQPWGCCAVQPLPALQITRFEGCPGPVVGGTSLLLCQCSGYFVVTILEGETLKCKGPIA